MKRLRIAFAMINCNRKDGSARAVNEVAERIAENHEVHLFARRAEELDLSRVRWHPMPGPAWPEVADFVTYHLLADIRLRRNRFDIVHSIGANARSANVITIQNIQPAKRKLVDARASSTTISLPRKITRRLYLDVTTWAETRMYADRPNRGRLLFLPVSKGVERELLAHYHVGNALIRIIPNAADTNIFKPLDQPDRARWRRANGLTERDLLVVFVGGEWRRKGLDLAIRAIGKLPTHLAKLMVVGQDPELHRFQTLASEVGVANRVLFLGFREDVANAMAAADVFLFPSWYEAFSLATIEAAACGLPILATRVNGAEDFVVPGENGFFIEHDPEQIARVLGGLIGASAECKRMGINARNVVERRYTWDRVAKLTEQAYLEYLAGE